MLEGCRVKGILYATFSVAATVLLGPQGASRFLVEGWKVAANSGRVRRLGRSPVGASLERQSDPANDS
jgi:hypothetical protein